MIMNKTTIYGLYSTRDNTIRYIGKANDPKNRLRSHIWSSQARVDDTYKSCWIRKELNDGFKIEFQVLEVCDINEWPIKEQEHIKKFENLTNHHKGGLGGSPLKYNKSYPELKEWVNNNLPKEITSHKKWREYIKSNHYGVIPVNPNKVYKNDGWTCWADFLNTTFHRDIDYVSYDEFREWVINNVKNHKEFMTIKKPYGITTRPEKIYNDVWIGWFDIFDNSLVTDRSVLWDYDTCKKYLNDNYGDITMRKFRELCKNNELPYHIPKKPERCFENFRYTPFLRLNHTSYLSFNEAKEIIHTLHIKSNKEWRKLVKENKIPPNIPNSPDSTYKNEWVNWYDWLGKEIR